MEKTCLNCAKRMTCVRFNDNGAYTPGAVYVEACSGCGYTPDTLEQRYAQLEKVALRMFQKLDVTTMRKDDELDGIEAELERLGVFND